MNWYTHYIGDYLRDTMHLSWLEDLAYRRLLETYYATEKPIPTSVQQVFNICRTRNQQEEDAVMVVLKTYFTETPDGYRNHKADELLAKSKYVQEKRSKAGSWDRSKKATHVEQVFNKLATISLPEPLPQESKVKTVSRRSAPRPTRIPEDFIPLPEHYELAKSLGINCEMEFQKFRDHFLGVAGSRGVKRDWPATLRNWFRNAVNYGGSNGKARQQTFGEIATNNNRRAAETYLASVGIPRATGEHLQPGIDDRGSRIVEQAARALPGRRD